MMRKKLSLLLVVATVLVAAGSAAESAVIDVLWYSGGVSSSANYKGDIGTTLVSQAAANTSMNTWNITWWDAGAKPAGDFDVLVTVSNEGYWNTGPSFGALDTAWSGITFGDRLMVTGQDADWHYLNTGGHQSNSNFDSSQGFLIDAINWAGSGTGMGAVFLSSNVSPDWIPSSKFPGLGTRTTNHGNDVTIPGAYASFPINEGLTSAGLSNWSSSHHDFWNGYDTNLWTPINMTTDSGGGAVTLVSAATDDGGTKGEIPEPSTVIIWSLLGVLGIAVGWCRRRKA